jgi:hypothetical protein
MRNLNIECLAGDDAHVVCDRWYYGPSAWRAGLAGRRMQERTGLSQAVPLRTGALGTRSGWHWQGHLARLKGLSWRSLTRAEDQRSPSVVSLGDET